MELISHHLCPFLHRSAILLTKKGLKQGEDFQATRIPVYDLPSWLYELSPKGSMPVLKMDDGKIMLRSVVINSYFDETISPSMLPADAFERAQHRILILACGDLLDQMRMVYTAKDGSALHAAIDKLFAGLKDVEKDLSPVIKTYGRQENGMVDSAFATLFTLALHFDRIKNDPRWSEMREIRTYADHLVADPVVIAAKSPNYDQEFDRFFNYFGSAFKTAAI